MGKRHKLLKCVQYMRTKLIGLMERVSLLFAARCFHIFVTAAIGITLIILGGIFIFANRIREVPDWSKHGPGILIASDQPLRGTEVLVLTEDDGTTTLVFREEEADKILSENPPQSIDLEEKEIQSESGKNIEDNQKEQDEAEAAPQEEYHLWIYLDSLEDAPLYWTIPEQFCDVRNYELFQSISGNHSDFFVNETNKSSGSDRMTAFRITFGEAPANMAEINISEDSEHTAFRSNGLFIPRVPFVFPWHGYGRGSEHNDIYDDLIERNRYIGDADLMRLSINNCPMYFPILKIMTSYTSLSLVMQHDLELMWISPEPWDGYPLINWTQYVFSSPTIQFRDKTWENNTKRNNLLGGIFVGLGLNVIFPLFNLLPRKKKR